MVGRFASEVDVASNPGSWIGTDRLLRVLPGRQLSACVSKQFRAKFGPAVLTLGQPLEAPALEGQLGLHEPSPVRKL